MAIASLQNDADLNLRESSEVAKSLMSDKRHAAENRPIQSHAERNPEVNAQPAVLLDHVEVAKGEFQTEDTYFCTLLDTVSAGILVIDVQTRRILDLNRHALQLIGEPVTQSSVAPATVWSVRLAKMNVPSLTWDRPRTNPKEFFLRLAAGDCQFLRV